MGVAVGCGIRGDGACRCVGGRVSARGRGRGKEEDGGQVSKMGGWVRHSVAENHRPQNLRTARLLYEPAPGFRVISATGVTSVPPFQPLNRLPAQPPARRRPAPPTPNPTTHHPIPDFPASCRHAEELREPQTQKSGSPASSGWMDVSALLASGEEPCRVVVAPEADGAAAFPRHECGGSWPHAETRAWRLSPAAWQPLHHLVITAEVNASRNLWVASRVLRVGRRGAGVVEGKGECSPEWSPR